MATKSEGRHTGEFLVSEAAGHLSRDEVTVTVAANTELQAGMVLGQLAASGKYVPYDNAGSDGSEEAAAVLYDAGLINGTGAPVDMRATVINGVAEVRETDLEWAAGLTDNDKDAGLADLRALFIKAR